MEQVTKIEYNSKYYYLANDLKIADPAFFHGCSIKIRQIIEIKKLL